MLHFEDKDMTEAVKDLVSSTPESELAQPRWSVISFDKLEASGILYAEAVSILETLDKKGVSGLCIIADEAAERVS